MRKEQNLENKDKALHIGVVSGKEVVVKDKLTLEEAKEMVQQNQLTDPSIKVKMMCFDKM